MPVLICLREKLWTRIYSIGDQVPTCPVFTRAKIKSRFGDFSQFAVTLVNNCVYSSHTDIKLCTYCLYRHTTVIINEILYLANQLMCSDFLTPLTPLIIPHRLSVFLESLIPLKNWCSIHTRWSKSGLKHSIRFCGIFSKFKIEYRSSKVSSRPDFIFEIHQRWSSGFNRVYSSSYCSGSLEHEIIKISQSSHKMYINNILNFQESTQF